jgi:tRNA threonylcarbamoyladenosine biosynthesis protein TsaB
MPLILHIDTALDKASVCISHDGVVPGLLKNKIQKDHAAWIQPAIAKLLNQTGYEMKHLNAVALSNGPGSYTGLRVGLATAKGICFALNIPLITISTLDIMAHAAGDKTSDLLCPMIDARRMEVYTALYDKQFNILLPPQAMILTETGFHEYLKTHSIGFFGNGALKFKTIMNHQNARFSEPEINVSHMIPLAEKKYRQQEFANLAYTEPFYIKDFFQAQPPV